MAKRKRLGPAQSAYLPGPAPDRPGGLTAASLSGAGAAPIAQVSRDAAASAALEAVSAELEAARAEGRLIQALPLDAVRRDYLVRDRVVVADEEMATLKASLAARGQQTPIDVVDLGDGAYGLISGWRRLAALAALHAETGEARFATVQALLRQPGEAGAAYTAMVEENEIRVGLSPFERARIVAKSVEQGVFADEATALKVLFAAGSRAKRSKIGSFVRLVVAFEDALRFPGAIAERLGLRIAKALEADPGFAPRLRAALAANPPATAEAELAQIEAALRGGRAAGPAAAPAPALQVSRRGDGITLRGAAVTPAFEARLRDWLRSQGF
jgi:ParB-like chromosome segregation protein Spo0J